MLSDALPRAILPMSDILCRLEEEYIGSLVTKCKNLRDDQHHDSTLHIFVQEYHPKHLLHRP